MYLFRILFIIEIGLAYEWNTSILENGPWGVDNCQIDSDCNEIERENADCPDCTDPENCTIKVAVILPNQEFYLVNLEEVRFLCLDAPCTFKSVKMIS